MTTKVAVVGPEESKWTEEQKSKAKENIVIILTKESTKQTIKKYGLLVTDTVITLDFSTNTLVSGHCPKGGVDIWAEEIADKLGIKKEIYPAEVNQWEDSEEQTRTEWGAKDLIQKKGFRSRNIQIAEACDILYCIVPKKSHEAEFQGVYGSYPDFCRHCEVYGHPTNGGCWTMKYAKKLGKEVHLVVIN